MHHIHLAEGMRLRFPARTADFDQGVEIGIVAALMSQDLMEFSRKISNENLGQVRALVEQFGYRLVEGHADEEFVELKDEADQIGFSGALSGPLVRSSYRAGRLYRQAMDARDTVTAAV